MMSSVLAIERSAQNMYERLISMLDEHGARYRLIEHSAEGRTEIVSRMRGHELRAAAKCIILLVKLGRKQKQFVLAVVPGDKKISLAEIKSLYQATYVSFASTATTALLDWQVLRVQKPALPRGRSESQTRHRRALDTRQGGSRRSRQADGTTTRKGSLHGLGVLSCRVFAHASVRG
jgi:hypothetical protein